MKVLSLLQPWASLAAMGIKTIETRSWQTSYRGELLIHASMGKKGREVAGIPSIKKHIGDFDKLPFGAIIGVVALTDIIPVEHLPFNQGTIETMTKEAFAFGPYKGRYAWIFSEARMFQKFYPARGTLSLWEIDESLIDEMRH